MATMKKIRHGILYTAGGLGAGAFGVFLWKSNYSLECKGAISLGITTLGLCGTIWHISSLKRKQQKYESEIKEIVDALAKMAAVHMSEKELSARREAAGGEATESSNKENGPIIDMWNRLKTWINSFGRSADFLEPPPVVDDIDAQMLEQKLKMRPDLPNIIKGMELYRRPRNTAHPNSKDPINAIPKAQIYKYLETRYPEISKDRPNLEGEKSSNDEISDDSDESNDEVGDVEEIDVAQALENHDIMYPNFVS